jgi:hypothetical protein
MMASFSTTLLGQSATKSPYSQFGLGVLSDRSQGMSRGMNGVGIALQQGDQVNTLNPASYGGVDSLTMLFDASVTGHLTNFKEGALRQNGATAAFDYIVGSFRAWRNTGIAVGVLPLTNIGYSYNTVTTLSQDYGSLTETYNGEGGLHEVFLGIGWRPMKQLSVGVNAGYVWGDMNRTVVTSNSSISSLKKSYSSTVKSYKADFGVQYRQRLTKNDLLTLGATVGIGHKLGADANLDIINMSKADTTSYTISNALELPWTFGFGASWTHRQSLTVAADIELQQWGKTSLPSYVGNNYLMTSDQLKDRFKINAGMEWIPDAFDVNHYLNRIHYRIGAGLSTPYYKINGNDGPKDFSVSIGLGLPIQNQYNARSFVNISGQWVHSSAKDFITENMFRINIGITFNERWFAKWKVE